MKNVGTFIIAIVLSLSGIGVAFACSCMRSPETIEEAERSLAKASAAFLGKVVGTSPTEGPENQDGRLRHGWATIHIVDAIKGVEADTTQLIYVNTESCGGSLRAGTTYFMLMYPRGPNAPLTFNGCGALIYESPGAMAPELAELQKRYVSKIISLYRIVAQ